MKKSAITLLDSQREFLLNEIFFSCTDQRGIIESGNAVFTRVSAYTEAEMLGQPHNMIRHPDMPRAVFRLFWKRLLAGQPIAAYIKNLAKDGRFYWVLALATPVAGGGFISVRFKPSSDHLPQVQALYRQMRDVELDGEARGEPGESGMDTAESILLAALRARGFADYDAFVRTALLREELNSRDAALARERRELWPTLVPVSGEAKLAAGLRDAYLAGRRAYAELNGLYGQLDEFAQLNESLKQRSRQIFHLTSDFSLVAFNVALKASRLGHEGRSIDVIAGQLGESAEQVSRIVRALESKTARVSERLGEVIFNLAWARLQFEMTVIYYHEVHGELVAGTLAPEHPSVNLRLNAMGRLQSAFSATGERAVDALRALAGELAGLTAQADDLRKLITFLQVTRVGGQVEASRMRGDDAFVSIFSEVREHVESTTVELAELTDVATKLGVLARQAPVFARTIAAVGQRLARDGSLSPAHAAIPAKLPENAPAAPAKLRTPPIQEYARTG